MSNNAPHSRAHAQDPTPDGRGDGTHLHLASRAQAPSLRTRKSNAARLLHGWLIFAVTANLIIPDTATGASLAQRATGALVAGMVFLAAFRRERRNTTFARLSGLAQTVYRAKAVLVGTLVTASVAWFVPWLGLSPMRLVMVALVLVLVSAVWSFITRQVLGARRVHRVLIVGDGDPVRSFISAFEDDPHPEFEIAGVLSGEEVAGNGQLGTLADLEEILAREAIDTVALAVTRDRLDLFARLAAWRGADITVQELPQFSEKIFGRVPVEQINAAWFMHMIHPFYTPYSRFVKRAGDIAAALFIGLLALPMLPFVALLVRVTSRGPVLFSQVRVGEHGEEFHIYKFRTMVVDAERNGAQWASKNDPRITASGRIMRATRLDELPQLWNILRGHMSFVGPRPERPEFVTELEREIPYYQRRHLVKPGLTGWAQVRLGYSDSVDGAADKLGFELYYLKHQSLFLDFVIFVETVRVVLLRFGSR